MQKRHVVVLGAGIAGLTTAYRLIQEGLGVTVVEKSPMVGGLARSYERDGYTYDFGPHRFHSNNPELQELVSGLLGDNLGVRDRKSRIFMEKRFFLYPLKLDNLVKNLPAGFLLRAFFDYLCVKAKHVFKKPTERNFEEWVHNRYGHTLYRKFFGVYTEKTWGIPCTEISADWASQRITLLSLWDAVKKTVFRPKAGDQPRTYVSKFWYPKRGGIGMICKRLAEEVERGGGRVILDADVRELKGAGDRIERVVYAKDGADHSLEPDAIISTIPITILCRMTNPAPSREVLDGIAKMRHRSMVFVYVALDRESVTDDHWIYLPEDHLTIHRISEFRNFSEHSAPPGKTLLCTEITCDFEDEVWNLPDEELRRIAVDDLVKIGLIRAEEVDTSWSHRTRYAYPIYDLDYKGRLQGARDFVERFTNLYTAGRQGLFKYNNMDHSIEMGIAVSHDLRTHGHEVDDVASGEEYFG